MTNSQISDHLLIAIKVVRDGRMRYAPGRAERIEHEREYEEVREAVLTAFPSAS